MRPLRVAFFLAIKSIVRGNVWVTLLTVAILILANLNLLLGTLFSANLKLDLEKYWTYIECDDLEYNCDREYDLIFIDSSHNYIETLLELKKFSKFIKVGKAIFLHDTLNITEGANVIAAVHSFLCREILREGPNANSKWRYTELAIPYGLGVLERLR